MTTLESLQDGLQKANLKENQNVLNRSGGSAFLCDLQTHIDISNTFLTVNIKNMAWKLSISELFNCVVVEQTAPFRECIILNDRKNMLVTSIIRYMRNEAWINRLL